jgi:hypothetical protein
MATYFRGHRSDNFKPDIKFATQAFDEGIPCAWFSKAHEAYEKSFASRYGISADTELANIPLGTIEEMFIDHYFNFEFNPVISATTNYWWAWHNACNSGIIFELDIPEEEIAKDNNPGAPFFNLRINSKTRFVTTPKHEESEIITIGRIPATYIKGYRIGNSDVFYTKHGSILKPPEGGKLDRQI